MSGLVKKIFDIPQRQRKADVHHYRQPDDLGAGLEVAEEAAFGNDSKLSFACRRLKASSSDNALAEARRAGLHHPAAPATPSPELNPIENVWQFICENWFSDRVFKSYDDIVALCCEAWNKIIDDPDRITSVGWRKWANGF